jgi:hypothetical protein
LWKNSIANSIETRQIASDERVELCGRLVRDVDLERKMPEWRLAKLVSP